MSSSISLPTFQNWSCHSCGGCCRRHAIVVTPAERQMILDQKWTAADGVPEGPAAFVRSGGQDRLAHRSDGACVFLDEQNHCRIHAKFGEAAKPLGCRMYPFAFHPSGASALTVSLRFDCPSVSANLGTPIKQQRGDLQVLRDLAVPAQAAAFEPPAISPGQKLDWADTQRIMMGLRDIVCDPNTNHSLATRLVHALFVAGMLGQATFDKVRGHRLEELIQTLATCAPQETVASADELAEPSSLARAQFRLTVAQYAVLDTLARTGIGYRLGKALAGFRFTRGGGQTPAMHPELGRVAFADLEQPFGGNSESIDRLLERYFDVKLTGMAFCGLGCYGMPVVEGFQNLALLYPVTMYIARWFALGRGEKGVSVADVEKALAAVDHHYGRSPLMGWPNFRGRVHRLAEQDEIARLVGWYGR